MYKKLIVTLSRNARFNIVEILNVVVVVVVVIQKGLLSYRHSS